MTKRTSLWLTEELKERLAASSSTSLSDGVREVAERYFALIDNARRGLRDVFTTNELSLLVEMCNGAVFQADYLDAITSSVQKLKETKYYVQWQVDRQTLLVKLQSLTLCQNAALVDAIERFWRAVYTGFTPNIEDLLN